MTKVKELLSAIDKNLKEASNAMKQLEELIEDSGYNIEINKQTGGFCCDFEHNGKKYYADLSFVPFCGTECMIFERDNNGEVNWGELYCKRNIGIYRKKLVECIEDFKENYCNNDEKEEEE